MKNLELKLIDEITTENKEIKYYQNQYYEIRLRKYLHTGYKSVNINRLRGYYIPAIEVIEDNDNYDIVDFRIQTTSYGALSTEQIKEITKGYEIAIATVEQLEKMFLNK